MVDPGPFFAPPQSTQGFDESGFTTPGADDVRYGSDKPSAFGAAFRMDNPFWSAASAEQAPDHVDPDFDSKTRFEELVKDPKYLPHVDSFLDVHNDKAWDAKKRQIDRETEDNKVLDALPWYQSVPLRMLAGTLDPTIALPGMTIVRGAKGGVAIARTAATAAGWSGAAGTIQESVLQASQETRTATDTAVTIGGSIVLGGLLGTAGAKLLSSGEIAAAGRALDETLAAMSPGVEITPTVWGGGRDLAIGTAIPRTATKTVSVNGKIVAELNLLEQKDGDVYVQSIQTFPGEKRKGYATALMDDLRREFPGVKITTSMQTDDGAAFFRAYGDGSLGRPLPGDAGAAAVRPGNIEIAGAAASATANATRRLNPLLRALTSDSPAWREIAVNLVENPLYLKKNFEGAASEVAVETLMQGHNGRLVKALQTMNEEFKAYRAEGGKFTWQQFKEQAGRAARTNDEHPDPHVAKTAQAWRKNVIQPMADEAVELKLFSPEDLKVTTADSYFSRMWNKNRLIAREGEFKEIVARWVHGEAPKWAAEFDAETAAKAAKLVDAERIVYLTERRIDRAAKFDDLNETAREIAADVFNTLTGKTGDRSTRPEFLKITARGPLKERTFLIPDKLVEDFLEHDIEKVGRRYVRVMGSDLELARKFGSADMVDQETKIREDYARLRAEATDEKARLKLSRAEESDVKDLHAMRDLLRGIGVEGRFEADNYAKWARMANHFNYLRAMGQVVLSSVTDVVRPAMVHGLGNFMQTTGQLIRNLDAVKLSVNEAQLAGNVAERWLSTRLGTLTDILDPYASRGPVEAMLEKLTDVASTWNGIRIWTDGMKAIASVTTQNRILKGVTGFAKTSAREKSYLAYLGIDESMAGRIAAQMSKHGETLDGVRVANTEKWEDEVARRTYRAAINKDVDSIIVERGVGDIPVLANTSWGRVLLQFRGFALASHQRVLLRGLQEDQARFVGGLIAMTTFGMLMTYLRSWTDNRPAERTKMANNPGWWIGEGLDRSGVFSVPMELANTFEKAFGTNPIKGPLKTFDKGSGMSQKLQNRNLPGQFLGPSFGLLSDVGTAAGIPAKLIGGQAVTRGDKNALARVFPFNSYAGIRQMINYVLNPPENRP